MSSLSSKTNDDGAKHDNQWYKTREFILTCLMYIISYITLIIVVNLQYDSYYQYSKQTMPIWLFTIGSRC